MYSNFLQVGLNMLNIILELAIDPWNFNIWFNMQNYAAGKLIRTESNYNNWFRLKLKAYINDSIVNKSG